jgi:hypothetical protein
VLPSREIDAVLRVEDGDDSTYLTLLRVHAAASRTCVCLGVVPLDFGANADSVVTSVFFEGRNHWAHIGRKDRRPILMRASDQTAAFCAADIGFRRLCRPTFAAAVAVLRFKSGNT